MAKTASKRPQGKSSAQRKPRVDAQPDDQMSVSRRIAWWSLLAMVFLVPVAMSNATWLGFRMPMTYDQFDIAKVFLQRVLGLVALTAWGWDLLLRGGKIRRTPVDWLILAFLAWVTISTIFSISPATAFFGKYRRFEGLLSFINYAVIYFLVLQFADRPSRVRKLAQSLFWAGVVVAGYGVMQSLGADIIKWGSLPFEVNRAFSTYGNPDLLGGFLMFSLPISLGLVLSEERLGMRLIYWVGFTLNVWCWIVAFTRGAWIGGLVSIPLVAVIAWRHHSKLEKVDWLPIGAVAAIAATIIGKSLSNPNQVMNFAARFKSIGDFQGGSGGTRTEIWQAAIAAIKDRPIFGFGADTFRLVFPKYKPLAYTADAGYRSVADNVHDYPLQLAAGIGVVGVLLMYGIFVWVAVRSAPLVFKRSDDHRRILFGSFWAACAGYLVQLMFGLSVTGNTFLLWAAMGVVLAPTASHFEVKAPSWGMVAAVFAMVLAGLGIGYQFVYMQADYSYLITMVASQGEARVQAAQTAAKLNPLNDMYRAEVGLAYRDLFLGYLQAAQQAQGQSGDSAKYLNMAKDYYDKSVASLEDTIKFVPWEYDNYVFLASVHNMAGQSLSPKYYQNAIDVATKGIQIEPYGPAVRLELARGLAGAGQLEQALKEAQTASSQDPQFDDAWWFVENTLEQLGRKDEALKMLQARAATKPDDAETQSALQRLAPSAPATATK